MDPAAALKANSLFKGFTDTGVQIVARIAAEKSFPQGAPLFVEAMVADTLLLIAKGKVRLTSKTKNGDEVPVGEVGEGDYLGEISLLQPGQRLCTATAVSPVTAFEIRHADFQKLLGSKPQACLKLLMGIVAGFGQKVVENKETFKALLSKP